jgi:hypothetical protein
MKFAADENLNNEIIRRLRNQIPDIDIVRIQDTDAYQKPDDIMLEWCANEGRILLTHDQKTMPIHASNRIAKGLLLPGVLIFADTQSFKKIVDDIILIIVDNNEDELRDRVTHLPY